MSRKRLTDLFVERLKPPAAGRARDPYCDTTFPGLELRVTKNGHKSWSLRYRTTAGRQRRYTIGPYPAFKPADARKAASQALHRVEAGGDPAQEKRARRAGRASDDETFAGGARRYLKQQVEKNTAASTYRETARIIEKDVIPEWGKRPLRSIAKRDVVALIDAKAFSGAEVQANRVLARLKTLFGWAVAKDLIEANPCDGLRPPTREKARDRVLSEIEIAAFWTATGELGSPFGPLFRLLLLTAQRRDEVATMEWAEIDLERRLWSLPRGKVKNDQGHDVHLSGQAIDILTALPRIAGGLVFSTNGRTAVSGFSRAKERVDGLMATAIGEDVEPWIIHDLRRTAATGMARLKIAPHVVDRVLNHTSGTIRGVARIYNRFEYAEERRAALETWGRALEAMVKGGAPANVVELAPARA